MYIEHNIKTIAHNIMRNIQHIMRLYQHLLYKLLKISLFIGPKRPRDKSSNCHINCLARAGRSILVTKFRADVLFPLSHSACPSKEVQNLGIRKIQHFVTFAK